MKAIKTGLKALLSTLITVTVITGTAEAQSSTKDKQAEREKITKSFIESQHYNFVPQFVLPFRGGTRNLTSYYSLQISKDTIISYLPYFGRAYTAPLNTTNIGFDFTSTNFTYAAIPGKKGGWSILIKPKNNRSVEQFSLRIFDNSSASLTVTSLDRDPISYQGYITAAKQKQ